MDPVSTLSSVLSSVSSIVTAAIGWMGQFVATITATGHELLLLFVVVPLVGLGIGLLKRLLSA